MYKKGNMTVFYIAMISLPAKERENNVILKQMVANNISIFPVL